jgi:hypothetical protein
MDTLMICETCASQRPNQVITSAATNHITKSKRAEDRKPQVDFPSAQINEILIPVAECLS